MHGIDPPHEVTLGPKVDASAAKLPQRKEIQGRYVILAPLHAATHSEKLWEALRGPANDRLWLYLFDGPFAEYRDFHAALEIKTASAERLYFAVLDRESAHAMGYAAFMRIEPVHRCIEVGSILYAPVLQRTRGATEAMYLMARHAFEELGYRRYEWKCDALNEASRRAALRLGFQFEGIFRQHMIVKGRNRDTAWFSMLDHEWPARKAAFERWLHPSNFHENGRQLSSLSTVREMAGRSAV